MAEPMSFRDVLENLQQRVSANPPAGPGAPAVAPQSMRDVLTSVNENIAQRTAPPNAAGTSERAGIRGQTPPSRPAVGTQAIKQFTEANPNLRSALNNFNPPAELGYAERFSNPSIAQNLYGNPNAYLSGEANFRTPMNVPNFTMQGGAYSPSVAPEPAVAPARLNAPAAPAGLLEPPRLQIESPSAFRRNDFARAPLGGDPGALAGASRNVLAGTTAGPNAGAIESPSAFRRNDLARFSLRGSPETLAAADKIGLAGSSAGPQAAPNFSAMGQSSGLNPSKFGADIGSRMGAGVGYSSSAPVPPEPVAPSGAMKDLRALGEGLGNIGKKAVGIAERVVDNPLVNNPLTRTAARVAGPVLGAYEGYQGIKQGAAESNQRLEEARQRGGGYLNPEYLGTLAKETAKQTGEGLIGLGKVAAAPVVAGWDLGNYIADRLEGKPANPADEKARIAQLTAGPSLQNDPDMSDAAKNVARYRQQQQEFATGRANAMGQSTAPTLEAAVRNEQNRPAAPSTQPTRDGSFIGRPVGYTATYDRRTGQRTDWVELENGSKIPLAAYNTLQQASQQEREAVAKQTKGPSQQEQFYMLDTAANLRTRDRDARMAALRAQNKTEQEIAEDPEIKKHQAELAGYEARLKSLRKVLKIQSMEDMVP